MGIHLRELIPRKEITLESLQNKILVIDSFNILYQMLTTIRQRDGTPLTDNQGNITSHLVGLFSRTSNFLEKGMKLAFVFDGTPPDLKKEERQRRSQLKEEALAKYRVAASEENIEDMKKYASRTAKLTPTMVEETKQLVQAFGCPIIQAPCEGEAQAAYMAHKGDGYAVVSQDYDSLLYNAPKVIHNLSAAGKRKKTKVSYEKIHPEMITLSEVFNNLGIDQDQLIALSMLIGTDYNKAGVKGIGPHKGLKLVKEYGSDFEKLFKSVEWEKHCKHDWQKIFTLFKKMPTTDDYTLKWNAVDEEKLKELLIEKHDFSKERITQTLTQLAKNKTQQKGLGEFF